MKITIKYDQGVKDAEVVTLEIQTEESNQLIEGDYQYRLKRAKEGEVIERRTAEEIFEELNKQEYNSWQTHNKRHTVGISEAEESDMSEVVDLLEDSSQMEAHERQEDYEDQCQRIREVLKPEQADMIIAICLNEVSVSDYALSIGDSLKNVSKRFVRIKNSLREILS